MTPIMKATKRHVIVVACALGFLGGFMALQMRSEKGERGALIKTSLTAEVPVPATSLPTESIPKGREAGVSDPATIDPSSHVGNYHSTEIAPGIELSNGAPYNDTILRLAVDRPELNLTASEIIAVQEVYTQQCEARLRLEVKLARVSREGDATKVVIPRYKAEHADSLLQNLHFRVSQVLPPTRVEQLWPHLENRFIADNDQLGAMQHELEIRRMSHPYLSHEVRRKIILYDANTPIDSIEILRIDHVRIDNRGIYRAQPEFFVQ